MSWKERLDQELQQWLAAENTIRQNHINTILETEEMSTIKLRKEGIRAIDRRIKDVTEWHRRVIAVLETELARKDELCENGDHWFEDGVCSACGAKETV